VEPPAGFGYHISGEARGGSEHLLAVQTVVCFCLSRAGMILRSE